MGSNGSAGDDTERTSERTPQSPGSYRDGVEHATIDWQADHRDVAVFEAVYDTPDDQVRRLTFFGDHDTRTLIKVSYTAPVEVFDDLLETSVVAVAGSIDMAPLS